MESASAEVDKAINALFTSIGQNASTIEMIRKSLSGRVALKHFTNKATIADFADAVNAGQVKPDWVMVRIKISGDIVFCREDILDFAAQTYRAMFCSDLVMTELDHQAREGNPMANIERVLYTWSIQDINRLRTNTECNGYKVTTNSDVLFHLYTNLFEDSMSF